MPSSYLPDIGELSFHDDHRFSTSAIVVSSYAGYGVSGTNILFKPESVFVDDQPHIVTATTLPSTTSQPLPPSLMTLSPPDGGGSSWKIIVGVTVGVGGALVLSVVLAIIMMVASRWGSMSICTAGQ